MKKIGLINHYKLLTRLYRLQEIGLKQSEYKNSIDSVINKFRLCYPNMDINNLKEKYIIKVDNGVEEEIRFYSYPEYETPNMDGYNELLNLQVFCNKYFKPEFRTMVGEKYWNINDFKEYEVLYIQENFKTEQLFLLLNKEYNKELIVKVNEWRCGHLQGESGVYSTKELMLSHLLESYNKRYENDLERIERLKKED